jgi:hypothetical protein
VLPLPAGRAPHQQQPPSTAQQPREARLGNACDPKREAAAAARIVPEELEVTVGNVRIEQRVAGTKLRQTRVREPSAPEDWRQVEAPDTDFGGTGAGRVVARERIEIGVGAAAERGRRGDIAEDGISERLVVERTETASG